MVSISSISTRSTTQTGYRTHRPRNVGQNVVSPTQIQSSPCFAGSKTRSGLLGIGFLAALTGLVGCQTKPEKEPPVLEIRLDDTTLPGLSNAKGWFIPTVMKPQLSLGKDRVVELVIQGTIDTNQVSDEINRHLEGKSIHQKDWEEAYFKELKTKVLEPALQEHLNTLLNVVPNPNNLDRFDVSQLLQDYLKEQTRLPFVTRPNDEKKNRLYYKGLYGLEIRDIKIIPVVTH